MNIQSQKANERYFNYLKLLRDEYPHGFTSKQAIAKSTELHVSSSLFSFMNKNGFLSFDGNLYKFKVPVSKETANSLREKVAKYTLDITKRRKGIPVPSNKLATYADKTLIEEMKSRGFTITKKVVEIIEY